MNNPPKLSIIIPMYNEVEVIEVCHNEVCKKLNQLIKNKIISSKSNIIYVDDGSKDGTVHKLLIYLNSDPILNNNIIIKLANNFGHQSALWAGLHEAVKNSDINISIDADLQHDIDIFDEMISKYQEGNEVVLGIKANRGKESIIKKSLSNMFYNSMKLLGTNLEKNHADFRLLSTKVTEYILNYKNSQIFLRGIISQLNVPKYRIQYNVKSRIAGKSKYTYKKMFHLAFHGMLNSSVVPLRIILLIGCLVFLLSAIMVCYALIVWYQKETIPGWASLVIPIYGLGAIILISIGVLGEYIAKIFISQQNLPHYIVNEKIS